MWWRGLALGDGGYVRPESLGEDVRGILKWLIGWMGEGREASSVWSGEYRMLWVMHRVRDVAEGWKDGWKMAKRCVKKYLR